MEQLHSQLALLKNTHFSVLLVDRTTENKAFNYNLKGRKILTVDEVKSAFNTLKFYNQNKKHDIYIKAESGQFYNIVIDDLTLESLNTALNTIRCAYVLFSSQDNYQAIINLKKSDYTQNEANFITTELNKKFGDAKFAGANHYLRCAGFFNKKSTNNNEKSVLVDFTNIKTEEDNKHYFDNLLSCYKNNNTKLESLDIKIIDELGDNKAAIAKREIQAEIALCKRIFKQLDWSAVDFRIVKRLYRKGFSENEIAVALVRFTDFEDRHYDSHDYLTRTITKAVNDLGKTVKH